IQPATDRKLKTSNFANAAVEDSLTTGNVRTHSHTSRSSNRPQPKKKTDPAAEEERLRKVRIRATALHERGEEHFTSGRWHEAVSCLLQSICLVQNNSDAYYTLGLAYRMLQLPAKAASAFKQVIRLRPSSV